MKSPPPDRNSMRRLRGKVVCRPTRDAADGLVVW